jgi:hypothetical protein
MKISPNKVDLSNILPKHCIKTAMLPHPALSPEIEGEGKARENSTGKSQVAWGEGGLENFCIQPSK